MKNIFLINLQNKKSFDLSKIDALIESSAVELPNELCDNELDVEEISVSFCQNMGEVKRDVEEVVDYVLLNMIRKIITERHDNIIATDITMQTTNSDLKLDSFDSLELLAKIEILLNKDIFDADLETFSFGDIISDVKKIL